MASFYSFSPKTTSISFSWPTGITGLERVALSAQGDLQRILSAFFARPIVIALIYSHTFEKRLDGTLSPLSLPNAAAVAAATPDAPLVQNRQVHLQCSGKVVCTATSTVTIYSARCAHLFLEEKFAIGQLFAKIQVTPTFELLDVGVGDLGDRDAEKGVAQGPRLYRKYRLSCAEIECEILEVFARDMFVGGQAWLDDQPVSSVASGTLRVPSKTTLPWLALFSMLVFELYMLSAGRPGCVA
ncbi:hypothetical protein HMN09_00702800 [Mycena chlorophos]|uniref:Uncharacterized protein n=1 Tax=Mycena chlorophos TaxID=658473 RepID=A0A8H6W8C4_MYCCL|nr:hypothetical protein HMN09_00702800 [Mycena chlorophos]